MRWVNGGHNAPLIRRASGAFEELEATGTILGIMPGFKYREGEARTLEEGDLLLLYTDGVTEARNPGDELFGVDRLKEALDGLADRAPADVIEGVRATLREWTGDGRNDDDITMVVVKRET
jgi:sigma-B regulation protein RsbU (phosphoserine phosphatase)